jgi:uncharacterized protein YegL
MSEKRITEPVRADQGQLVMPFYLVCDVSCSMSGDMAALNQGVQRLRTAIVGEPTADDVAHVCVMTFSDTAKVVMPLKQLSEQEIPALHVEGGTNYGAAFHELARVTAQDVANFKKQGCKVWRPCAFFLTDGMPGDSDWYQTFQSTLTYDRRAETGNRSHPIFVPFGYRAARDDVMRKLAYPPERTKAYYARSHRIEDALNGILGIIINTMMTASRTVNSGQPAMVQQAPAAGSGIVQQDSEYGESGE